MTCLFHVRKGQGGRDAACAKGISDGRLSPSGARIGALPRSTRRPAEAAVRKTQRIEPVLKGFNAKPGKTLGNELGER